MAFAVRSHNHLWGKNNEDPFVFLYNQGWSHEFSKHMYLGWNKFGQERQYDKWGIHQPGSFFIPPGIVFPYIIEKELLSLFIISMEEPQTVFCFPGNPDRPLILGNPDTGTKTVNNIIQGLCLFQENPETGIEICI